MPKETYRTEHYDILLAQMLRNPTILHLASSFIVGSHLTDKRVGGTPVQALIFDVMKAHFAKYGAPPDRAVVMASVTPVIERYFRSPERLAGAKAQLDRFLSLAPMVTEKSERTARDLITHVYDLCVQQAAVDEGIDQYRQNQELSELRSRLDEIDAKQAALAGGLSVTGIIGMDLDDVGERVSTGLPFLDSRFGNGMGPVMGSLMAIIAPQGAGKTTLGIQLNVGQALAGRHTMLVLAEEGLSLSIRSKIVGCALGVNYETIRDDPAEAFPGKVKSAVDRAGIDRRLASKKLACLERYLHVLDLVSQNYGDNALEAIEGESETLRSKGQAPVYTYVDWAGIIADRMVGITGRTKEAELKSLSYGLSTLAHRQNGIFCVSQQMAGKSVEKGPFAVNDQYCAADCRGFTEPAKYVFVINPQDNRTGLSITSVAKSRDDARGDRMVWQLKGEIATFRDVTDVWDIKGRRLVQNRSSGSETQVPSEKPNRPSKDEVEE